MPAPFLKKNKQIGICVGNIGLKNVRSGALCAPFTRKTYLSNSSKIWSTQCSATKMEKFKCYLLYKFQFVFLLNL